MYAQLANIRRMLVKDYGASRSYLDRFYFFCSPDLYDALASHPEVTSLITSKVAETAKGALNPLTLQGMIVSKPEISVSCLQTITATKSRKVQVCSFQSSPALIVTRSK